MSCRSIPARIFRTLLTTHQSAPTARRKRICCALLWGPEDQIDCPTEAQRELFGPQRRRVPEMMDLKNPVLLGPVQNQEHHMNGAIARRNNFSEHILGTLEQAMMNLPNSLTGATA